MIRGQRRSGRMRHTDGRWPASTGSGAIITSYFNRLEEPTGDPLNPAGEPSPLRNSSITTTLNMPRRRRHRRHGRPVCDDLQCDTDPSPWRPTGPLDRLAGSPFRWPSPGLSVASSGGRMGVRAPTRALSLTQHVGRLAASGQDAQPQRQTAKLARVRRRAHWDPRSALRDATRRVCSVLGAGMRFL